MSKRQMIMLLGIWVMIFLFIGLPSTLKEIIAFVTGLIIVGIAYCMPAQVKCCDDCENCNCNKSTEKKDIPFVEHKSIENNQVTSSIESKAENNGLINNNSSK